MPETHIELPEYTQEMPTRTGIYWMRFDNNKDFRDHVVRVFYDEARELFADVMTDGSVRYRLKRLNGSWWSGPFIPPAMPRSMPQNMLDQIWERVTRGALMMDDSVWLLARVQQLQDAIQMDLYADSAATLMLLTPQGINDHNERLERTLRTQPEVTT